MRVTEHDPIYQALYQWWEREKYPAKFTYQGRRWQQINDNDQTVFILAGQEETDPTSSRYYQSTSFE